MVVSSHLNLKPERCLNFSQSDWSRTSTVTVLATLVHTHYVCKLTQGYKLEITGFNGSAALNIQPVLLQSLIGGSDWIAVVRDKVLRYYHLIRPSKPKGYLPTPETIRSCVYSFTNGVCILLPLQGNRATALRSKVAADCWS